MEKTENKIRQICEPYGIGATALSRRYGIPLRTAEAWFAGRYAPPEYVLKMIKILLENNL